MRKLQIVNSLLVLVALSCSHVSKDTQHSQGDVRDLFTQLRELNSVSESSLSSKEREKHMQHKFNLNQDLQDFLKQQENVTEFPSLEEKKQVAADEIIRINSQSEAGLDTQELDDLRQQRDAQIGNLQALLEMGELLQDIQNLNKVDEKDLSQEDRVRYGEHKELLNSHLMTVFSREENKSLLREVEDRKSSVLKELSSINIEDESGLTPDDLMNLREKRKDLIEELIHLWDGTLVPSKIEDDQVKGKDDQVDVQMGDQMNVTNANLTDEEEDEIDMPSFDQGKPLFERILNLNTIEESTLQPKAMNLHQEVKKGLNKELMDLLEKEESRFSNPEEEKEKNELGDELQGINETDESTLTPEQLAGVRDRREKIVNRLQSLLEHASRFPSTSYGISSKEQSGISVEQQKSGDFKVVFVDLLFAFNKTDLRKDVRKTLSRIARLLRDHPDATATIGGHSDNIGPEWAKEKIALGRAMNAQKYLIDKGIDAKRMLVQGHSDKLPIAMPFTLVNRRKNRRVEISIQMSQEDGSPEAMEFGNHVMIVPESEVM